MTKSKFDEKKLFNRIRKGELCCPFSNCTWSFFTSFELADHMNKDCNFGSYHGKLPCTHCCVELRAEDLKVHWRAVHKPIIKSLFSLTHDESVECPNYLCDEVFSPSFQECKRYIKHSIICRPLYICKVCKIEYVTENTLLKHKCDGTIKREIRKSVSKKEITIERIISDRPKLSIKEEKDLLEKWQQKIKQGNFLCPVPSCNKEFFVPNYYIKHLKKENEFDNIFQKIDAIECPFCSSPVKLFIFHRHMQNNHRDITQTLNQLKDGVTLSCPNALCATKSKFTSETGKEYLKHAINCRPLYLCNICQATLKTGKFYENHIKNCKEGSPLKNPTKMIKKISCKRAIKQEKFEEDCSLRKTSRNKSEKIKKLGYGTTKSKQDLMKSKTFKNSLKLLKEANLEFNSSETTEVSDHEILSTPVVIPSNVYKEQGNENQHKELNKSVKKVKGIVKSNRRKSTNSGKVAATEIIDVDHSNEPIHDEEQMYSSTPIVIPSDICDSPASVISNNIKTKSARILQEAIKKKLALENSNISISKKSAITNDDRTLENIHVSTRLTVAKIKDLINTWLDEMKKGIWRCLYPSCTDTFIDPSKLYSHLMKYPPTDKLRRKLFTSTQLPCCFCETSVAIPAFVRHLNQNHHQELQPVIKGKSLICPIEKCQLKLKSGEEYLRHVCNCPINKKEKEDRKEEERKKGLMTEWLSDVEQGTLLCPNQSCLKEFLLPDDFLSHINECTLDDMTDYILKVNLLTCPWCVEDVKVTEFPEHFQKIHFQIYDVINNHKSHFICPNFNCHSTYGTGEDLLKHTVTCATCLLCHDCRQTFELYDEFSNHDCLANDESFMRKSLDMWCNQVRSGQLKCPNPSCNECFFWLDDFNEHIELCGKTSKFMAHVLAENSIPCSFCREVLHFDDISKHVEEKHLEIYEGLKDLKGNKSVKCLNYKCKKIYEDGLKYYHHAAICRPLYLCSLCSKEFHDKEKFLLHYCMQNPILPDKRKKEERSFNIDDWFNKFKDADYSCPNVNCNETFHSYESLIPHLSSCKKDGQCAIVLKKNRLPCCMCESKLKIAQFVDHFNAQHSKVIQSLSVFSNRLSVRCPIQRCKKVLLDSGKYLQHIVRNHRDHMYFSQKPQKNQKVYELQLWHEEILSGNLICVKRSCPEKFTFIEHFLSHLRHCCRNDNPALNLTRYNSIPCLICKRSYTANELAEHFRKNHTVVFAQLRLVEQGICIHCPNSKCKQAFSNGAEYLQHVATECQPLFPCSRCKNEFETEELLSSHTCEEEQECTNSADKIWDKISQAPWYERVKRGDLSCPNSKCSKEFVLPRDFISHLRICSEGKEINIIMKRNELPCCFCKTYVLIGKYCTHLSSCHTVGLKKNQCKPKKANPSVSSSASVYASPVSHPSVEPPFEVIQEQMDIVEENVSPSKRGRLRKHTPRKISIASEKTKSKKKGVIDISHNTIGTDSSVLIEDSDNDVRQQMLINPFSSTKSIPNDKQKTPDEKEKLSTHCNIEMVVSKTIELDSPDQVMFDITVAPTKFPLESSKNCSGSKDEEVGIHNNEKASLLNDNQIADPISLKLINQESTSCSSIVKKTSDDHQLKEDDTLSPLGIEKTLNKDKLKKGIRIKRRISEDNQMYGINELKKKRKRKIRYNQRSSVGPIPMGVWTVTEKPRNIKIEEVLKSVSKEAQVFVNAKGNTIIERNINQNIPRTTNIVHNDAMIVKTKDEEELKSTIDNGLNSQINNTRDIKETVTTEIINDQGVSEEKQEISVKEKILVSTPEKSLRYASETFATLEEENVNIVSKMDSLKNTSAQKQKSVVKNLVTNEFKDMLKETSYYENIIPSSTKSCGNEPINSEPLMETSNYDDINFEPRDKLSETELLYKGPVLADNSSTIESSKEIINHSPIIIDINRKTSENILEENLLASHKHSSEVSLERSKLVSRDEDQKTHKSIANPNNLSLDSTLDDSILNKEITNKSPRLFMLEEKLLESNKLIFESSGQSRLVSENKDQPTHKQNENNLLLLSMKSISTDSSLSKDQSPVFLNHNKKSGANMVKNSVFESLEKNEPESNAENGSVLSLHHESIEASSEDMSETKPLLLTRFQKKTKAAHSSQPDKVKLTFRKKKVSPFIGSKRKIIKKDTVPESIEKFVKSDSDKDTKIAKSYLDENNGNKHISHDEIERNKTKQTELEVDYGKDMTNLPSINETDKSNQPKMEVEHDTRNLFSISEAKKIEPSTIIPYCGISKRTIDNMLETLSNELEQTHSQIDSVFMETDMPDTLEEQNKNDLQNNNNSVSENDLEFDEYSIPDDNEIADVNNLIKKSDESNLSVKHDKILVLEANKPSTTGSSEKLRNNSPYSTKTTEKSNVDLLKESINNLSSSTLPVQNKSAKVGIGRRFKYGSLASRRPEGNKKTKHSLMGIKVENELPEVIHRESDLLALMNLKSTENNRVDIDSKSMTNEIETINLIEKNDLTLRNMPSFPRIDVPSYESEDDEQSSFIDFKIEPQDILSPKKFKLPTIDVDSSVPNTTQKHHSEIKDKNLSNQNTQKIAQSKTSSEKEKYVSDTRVIENYDHVLSEPLQPASSIANLSMNLPFQDHNSAVELNSPPTSVIPLHDVPSDNSKLKEILFIVPKDGSIRSPEENNCLPDISGILNNSYNNCNPQKPSDSVENQDEKDNIESENEVIENALQDLLKTVPPKPVFQKTSLSTWKKKVSHYEFYCNYKGCGRTLLFPGNFISHMNTHSDASFKSHLECQLKCPECRKDVFFRKYTAHYCDNHNPLWSLLKEFNVNKTALCRNYKCNEVLYTINECVTHFRKCGFLMKCQFCLSEYKKLSSFNSHYCKAKALNTLAKDSDSDRDPNNGSSKDKSKMGKKSRRNVSHTNTPSISSKLKSNTTIKGNQMNDELDISDNLDDNHKLEGISPPFTAIVDQSKTIDCNATKDSKNKTSDCIAIANRKIKADDQINSITMETITKDYDSSFSDEFQQSPKEPTLKIKFSNKKKILRSSTKVPQKFKNITCVKIDKELIDNLTNDNTDIPILLSNDVPVNKITSPARKLKFSNQFQVHLLPEPDNITLTATSNNALNENESNIDVEMLSLSEYPKVMVKDSQGKKSDLKTWSCAVSNFEFYCPSKNCYQSHLRINTMFTHMKLCLKKQQNNSFRDYASVQVKCPECNVAVVAEKLSAHFRKEHLLLNWYFGEVEKGNWAVCQNYKCGKYMDDIHDIVQHFHRCNYLWRCKYCRIEYDNEPQVKKHHCCESSEGDDDNADVREEVSNEMLSNKKSLSKELLRVSSEDMSEEDIVSPPLKRKIDDEKDNSNHIKELKITNTEKQVGGRNRRKSAARAIEKLSSIVKAEVQPALKNSKTSEMERSSKSTLNMDDEDEYQATSNEVSSSDNYESNDSRSGSDSESEGVLSDDVGRSSAYLYNKKPVIRRGGYYDNSFFQQWLDDYTPTKDLFVNLIPMKKNIKLLLKSDYLKYLPHPKASPQIKISYYCSIKQRKSSDYTSLHQLKSLPSLDGSCSLTLNAGGSVWGLDWCPVPDTEDQYLAVAAHSSPSKVHSVVDTSPEHGLIQIWNVGKLNSNKTNTQPKLSLAICHSYGPVFDVKWCPSGCYMKEADKIIRLGLLAVAGGDGKVRLYSIPDPNEISKDQNVFVDMAPSLILLPQKQDSIETIQTGSCLSISWQHMINERKIAAGFADGGLRIWNPDTNSIFLTTEYEGNPAVLPIIHIDAHSYALRSLAWCPYNAHIIATVSKDKSIKIFNINEPYHPLFVFKRGFPLNVEWPITRIGFFFTEDDCFNITPTSARYMVLERLFKLVRDDKDTPHPTTRHRAAVWSCSYNNYLDLMATCDIAGEVMVSKNQDVTGSKTPTILLKMEPVYHIERTWDYPDDNEPTKTSIYQSNTKVVTQADVDCINLLEDYKKHFSSEEEVLAKYKYKFADSNKFEFTKHRLRSDPDNRRLEKIGLLQSSLMDEIETRSVQKVTWNQNYGCHTWLASGTKIGIIRLHNFKAWS